jgi:hypothetical protein
MRCSACLPAQTIRTKSWHVIRDKADTAKLQARPPTAPSRAAIGSIIHRPHLTIDTIRQGAE